MDTRAADEAAALDTLKKVDAAYAVADKNLSVDGSGSKSWSHRRYWTTAARGTRSCKTAVVTMRGETVRSYKVRGYADNPGDIRVIIATCTDVRNVKFVASNGVETPMLGPDGKPADFTLSRSELTKQMNGSWLLTSDQVLSGGPSCTLDAPL